MYKGKTYLAVIPARQGSKGIPNKNIVELCGRPLISYTINSALNSKYLDTVMVSTDGDNIAEIAVAFGAEVPYLRPKALASDQSKTIDSVIDVLDYYTKKQKRYDNVVLLQPTSPLRDENDIDSAIEIFSEKEEGLLSISEVQDSPILIRSINDEKLCKLLDVDSTVRRQDMPPYYRVNGAIYINRVQEISSELSFNDNMKYYIMDKFHSIDIDDKWDLKKAEIILNGNYTEGTLL